MATFASNLNLEHSENALIASVNWLQLSAFLERFLNPNPDL